MKAHSPAFPLYPKDWLSDQNVLDMSDAEQGLYFRMICLCWLDGSVPSDPEELRRKLRPTNDREWQRQCPRILKCFKRVRKGSKRMLHPRVERERAAQEKYRNAKSRAGLAGAKKRWQGHTSANGK